MVTIETTPIRRCGESAAGVDDADDERALVEQSKSDPEAVAILYRKHCGAISRYIRRRVGDAHESEDLISDTFMAMVRYLPRYRPRGAPFRAWLYRLATTQVNRWARRRRRAAMKTRAARAERTSNAEHSSASAMIQAEFVRQALLSLPPKLQAVLALHYMEHMSVSEIAQVLNCAEGTVKSRLSRGREKMCKKLGPEVNTHD